MWRRLSLVILISSAAIAFGALYVIYRLVDPLPPRHLVIAASTAGSGYDNVAKRYALILARHGVALEICRSAGAVEDLNLLRDPASGVQAALTTFGFTQSGDMDILYSLGGIFDAAIFIFYRDAGPITMFAQLRGKRIGMGVPGTATDVAEARSVLPRAHPARLRLEEELARMSDFALPMRHPDGGLAAFNDGWAWPVRPSAYLRALGQFPAERREFPDSGYHVLHRLAGTGCSSTAPLAVPPRLPRTPIATSSR